MNIDPYVNATFIREEFFKPALPKSTFERYIDEGKLPPPDKQEGRGLRFWRQSTIQNWDGKSAQQ